MAQPPSGSSLNFNLQNIIIATIAVLGLSALIYYVYAEVGEYFAWSLLFLVLLNVYLVYRVTIREKLGKKIFNEENYVDPSIRPGQKIETSTEAAEEKPGNQVFQKYDEEYPICPSCDSKLIPGLDYCENCGEKLTND